MEKASTQPSPSALYYVMNKSSDSWVKVSQDYNRKDDAVQALEILRKQYPFARLGGMRPF